MTFQIMANTVSINLASTTANVALGASPFTGDRTIRVFNDDQATCWVAFGRSNAIEAAAATGHPIATKSYQDFTVGPAITHIAAIGQGTPNGDVYATTGAVL